MSSWPTTSTGSAGVTDRHRRHHRPDRVRRGIRGFVTIDFEQSRDRRPHPQRAGLRAALEREKIVDRTSRGRRARVVSGKPLVGASAPFGLRWEDTSKTRLVLDPETAPVVRAIFSLAQEGVSLRGIAAEMEQRGIASPAGKSRWCSTSVRHILTRSTYTGSQITFRERWTRRPGGGTDPSPGTTEEQIIVPNVAPAW